MLAQCYWRFLRASSLRLPTLAPCWSHLISWRSSSILIWPLRRHWKPQSSRSWLSPRSMDCLTGSWPELTSLIKRLSRLVVLESKSRMSMSSSLANSLPKSWRKGQASPRARAQRMIGESLQSRAQGLQRNRKPGQHQMRSCRRRRKTKQHPDHVLLKRANL